MKCYSCQKQRANLKGKQSALMPQMKLLLCEECLKAKMEPRFVVVMAGRSGGNDVIADYIRHRRYIGEEITAKELIA